MQLKELIEQIEHYEDQKAEIAQEIRFLYGKAKHEGYNVKAIKRLIKERTQERNEVEENERKYKEYKKELDNQLTLFEQDNKVVNLK